MRNQANKQRRHCFLQFLECRRSRMVVLALGYMATGTTYTLPGLSLIDLEIRTSSSTKDIALMFLLRAGGGLIGSLFCGFLYDIVNADIILAIVQALAACTIVVAPWWRNAIGLSAFIGLTGLCCSVVNVGINFYCVSLWGDAHPPYLLFLTFLNSLAGAVLLPIASSLLLPRNHDSERMESYHVTNNRTSASSEMLNISISDMSFENNTIIPSGFSPDDVNIQYAFLIPGALMGLACIGHTLMAIHNKCRVKPHPPAKEKEDGGNVKRKPNINKLRGSVLLISFALLSANYGSLEETYTMFLFSFLVKHLNWDKMTAAWPLLGLHMSLFFSQFFFIWVSKILQSNKVMSVLQPTMLITAVVMCLQPLPSDAVVWGCTILSGIAIGPYGSTMVSWMANTFGSSGKITSFFFVMVYGSRMITSQLLGYLFDMYGPVWFVYMNVITVAMSCVAYGCTCLLKESRMGKVPNNHEPTGDTAEVPMMDSLHGQQKISAS